ncbi:CU044_2847 family protein [Paenarthrobacter sp. S56]|uniref:CU044_2847 family protein n=1 Tax=Paenarthrobacter sp. S56 TaxID=3138179 RepID=UPI003219658F
MTDVLRYEVGSGTVLVEVEDGSFGVDHPGRNEQGILDVGRRLEDALAGVRPAAVAALDSMQELAPENLEIEFGIKLAGDAGAIVSKNVSEGHFIVRITWSLAGHHSDLAPHEAPVDVH